jgi:hypothetical protein
MQTNSENTQDQREQPELPGIPSGPVKDAHERFLFVPGDVGRYLNVVFAASPEAAARTLTFKTTEPETGAPMVARVRSFVVDGRHLYSPHLRVFFALYAIMRRTLPDAEGYYRGDFRDLAREVGFKWHAAGSHKKRLSTPRLLAQLCRELRVNGYYVENVFYDQLTKEWVNRWENPVNILDSFSLEVRISGTQDRQPRYSFRFKISEHARRVFLQDSLPVPHQAVRRIDGRNDLAPVLLTFLSTVMADKTVWDRYTDELLTDDLRYTRNPGKPAEQKRVVHRALRYINGALIPTGTLAAEVRRSSDGRRNVLHVTKTTFQQTLRFVPSSRTTDNRHGPRQPWQRRPTSDERAKTTEWTTRLLDFAGDQHSAVFYQTAARRLIVTGNEQALWSAIADAQDLDRSGYIQTTRAQTLTRNLLDHARRLNVPLRRSAVSSQPPHPTTTDPTAEVFTPPAAPKEAP